MGEWANTYKLTNEFAAKMILDCMAHNFEKFTFEQVRYVQPKSNSNVVRCPRCGSTSVTTEEQGYGLFGWIGASQRRISARSAAISGGQEDEVILWICIIL